MTDVVGTIVVVRVTYLTQMTSFPQKRESITVGESRNLSSMSRPLLHILLANRHESKMRTKSRPVPAVPDRHDGEVRAMTLQAAVLHFAGPSSQWRRRGRAMILQIAVLRSSGVTRSSPPVAAGALAGHPRPRLPASRHEPRIIARAASR